MPPTLALALFSRYSIQLSSGTPLEMTWYKPLASSSRATGMVLESSVTWSFSFSKSSPLLPAIVLAAAIAPLNVRLSSVSELSVLASWDTLSDTVPIASAHWLYFRKLSVSFCDVLFVASMAFFNSSTFTVILRTTSSPFSLRLMLNVTLCAIFSSCMLLFRLFFVSLERVQNSISR